MSWAFTWRTGSTTECENGVAERQRDEDADECCGHDDALAHHERRVPRLDLGEHLRLGTVHEGERVPLDSGREPACGIRLERARFLAPALSDQVDNVQADLREAGVIPGDLREHRMVLSRDVLGAVEVVGELPEVAGGHRYRLVVRRKQGGADGIEQVCRVALQLAVRGYTALQLEERLRPPIRAAQDAEANGAEQHEQQHHRQERDEQLCPDRGGNARDESRQPADQRAHAVRPSLSGPHAGISFFSALMMRQSLPRSRISCGVCVMRPASRRRSA